MTALNDLTVGQLVAQNPARARVFEKFRIDYCCGGKLPLAEACTRRGASLDAVVAELEAVDALAAAPAIDWTLAPLGELADHIVATHHAYLSDELPRLQAMAERVAKVHGSHAPETSELRDLFLAFKAGIEEHALKEEQILFPWIKALQSGGRVASSLPVSVGSPIRCMEAEHEDAGRALERMRELTGDFNPPADACNTWRVLYASLEALEADMHVHVHKENSILFPRALELEAAAH